MKPKYDCTMQGNIRCFDIEAISLPIVYNKFGDHDPNGLLYVLSEDSKRIQKKLGKTLINRFPSLMKKFVL